MEKTTEKAQEGQVLKMVGAEGEVCITDGKTKRYVTLNKIQTWWALHSHGKASKNVDGVDGLTMAELWEIGGLPG